MSFLALALAATIPVLTPDASVMKFDELGIYEIGYAYRGQPEQQFPIAWSGPMDPKTGVACEPAAEQNGKPAFFMHCPWRHGTGIAFQQFTVNLPQSSRITLRGFSLE
jgi:hypothetical protein